MKEDIDNALNILKKGGVIIYPTDTIWGIGCDATNEAAVTRIYTMKKRADSKSMLVLVNTASMLNAYIREVPEIAWELIDAATEPMTIIYPGARNLAANLIAPDQSIGIRLTTDPFCDALIRSFRKPIVSTSANLSGEPAPPYFAGINKELLNQADYVVRWRQGETTPAKASSIIRLGTGGQVEIIRK